MMQGGGHGHSPDNTDQLLSRMVEELMQESENPPREVKGVSDEFLAQLDRVPKSSLKDKDCPICGNPFLEGEFACIPYNFRRKLLIFSARPSSACGPAPLPQGPSFRPRMHHPLAQAQPYLPP
jgi:hypothetical protein